MTFVELANKVLWIETYCNHMTSRVSEVDDKGAIAIKLAATALGVALVSCVIALLK